MEYWYERSLWVREREVIQVSGPRAECAGPTRGSAKNNSRVMLARPASDPLLAGHDLTRPVSFSSPLDPTRPDPTRDILDTS